MLVILKESIDNLGRTGDMVRVSDGYARNFLIPRNLVLIANEKNKTSVDHHKKLLEKKRLSERASSEDIAKKLAEYSCTIKRKSGEQDKLFGSVSGSDIADELKKAGYTVDKRQIQLAEPIKTLGVHSVSIRLQHDIAATLKVWVVKEE